MPYEPIESRRVYQRAEAITDRVWESVRGWGWFLKQTIAGQFTRAADSIGANVAGSGGRYHPGEVKKFLDYARGSLRETVYRVRRWLARGLIDQLVSDSLGAESEQLSKEINQSIAFQNKRKDKDAE